MPERVPEISRCSCVLPLRLSPFGPPLFLIHGVDGSVAPLQQLAGRVRTDRIVYGIQSHAWCGSAPVLTAIEEMAAHYLSEVLRLQPQGPYYLTGSSYGGMVAFEMAQQLLCKGLTVGLLGLIDSSDMSYLTRHSGTAPFWVRAGTR